MISSIPNTYTTFNGHRRILTGTLEANALAVRKLPIDRAGGSVLIFNDATGRIIDLDLRGSDDEIAARFHSPVATEVPPASASREAGIVEPKRGRPKLGVVPREVTLLPRHWDWLATQPGGASVALRKLVEEARRSMSEKDLLRRAHERAYHFMLALAGDFPGFEEATRALFANDLPRFRDLLRGWPADVREHAIGLASADPSGSSPR